MRGLTESGGWIALTCAALGTTLQAQTPRVHAVVASSEHRGGAPAVEWLCEEFLPALAAWPRDLAPDGPFALTVSADGVEAHATQVEIPAGLAALGAVTLSGRAGAPAILWSCEHDGEEQWHVPTGFQAPADWIEVLAAVGADSVDTPRTIAAPVLAGHLCAGLAEGDPRAALLRIGPALCGDVTWIATREADATLVRGRSGGGLILPLTLLLTAATGDSASPTALQLRAFAARDGDRGEAARQLGRADMELDVETLRALLHSDDELRFTAIRSLTRRSVTEALPQILDAATPEMPWSTLAARDALAALWPRADVAERLAARRALERNRCPELRGVDLQEFVDERDLTTGEAPATPTRIRTLAMLFCSGFGLLGLWRRERLRARPLRDPALS